MILVNTIRRSVAPTAALFLLSLGSCDRVTAPDPLSVYLLVSASIVASGGTAPVTIAATNAGTSAVTISEGCRGTYRTLNMQGMVVATQQFCDITLTARIRELAPGEQVSYVQTWEAKGAQGALPSGEYRVVAELFGRVTSPVRITVQ